MRKRTRASLWALALLLAAVVSGCSGLDAWQRETIFSPSRSAGVWYREPLAGTE